MIPEMGAAALSARRPALSPALALMSNAEDFLRDFLPTSFGKKQTQNNLAEKFAKTKRQVR